MLRYVRYKLEPEHLARLQPLLARLERAGIDCLAVGKEAVGREAAWTAKELAAWVDDRKIGILNILVITDDRVLSSRAAAFGMACIGVDAADAGYFDGAGLVVQDFEEISLRELEEYLLRFHGFPVTIAQTGRLLLREMTAGDVERLCEISREPGMELARREPEGENSFIPDRMRAYIRKQYRFYGYGLWSVLLREAGSEDTLVGCCGFSELETDDLALEMEYMLSEPYQGRGIGTEMCQAAMRYAKERLGIRKLWVRIHPQNSRGKWFAGSIGFDSRMPEERAVRPDEPLWMSRNL